MQHQHQTFDHDEHEPEDTVSAVAQERERYQKDPRRVLEFMEALHDHAHYRQYREEFVQKRELLIEYANTHFLVTDSKLARLYFDKAPRLVQLLIAVRKFATCYDHRKDYTNIACTVIQFVRPLLIGSWSRGPLWAELTVQRALLLTWYPRAGVDALADLDAVVGNFRNIRSASKRTSLCQKIGYIFWKHGRRLTAAGYFLRSFATSLGAK